MVNKDKTNPNLVLLIRELKMLSNEHEAPIWRDIAKRLEKPRRNWAEVNLSRISRYANENEVIVVPGKLLGAGDIDKPVTVAYYRASEQAVKKLAAAGGRAMTFKQLAAENPKGTGARIMG